MGLDHREPAYTDKAAPFIEEFGGKIGGLKFVEAHVPALKDRVPPMHIVRPDEEWTKRPFPGNNIVRASHPNDFQGLVDVLATKVVPGTSRDVMNAIDHIRGEAASDLVTTYGRYENPSHDGKVTLAVQPHQQDSSNYRRGSIVEHPNRPEIYLINWVQEYS